MILQSCEMEMGRHMREKVLITGGCGFIGSHIAEKLIANGYEVSIVDNLSTGKKCNIDFI